MELPDVVGNPLERARDRLQQAGVEVSRVRSLETPSGWSPRDTSGFETQQYVVSLRTTDDEKTVELDVVSAWLPPEK